MTAPENFPPRKRFIELDADALEAKLDPQQHPFIKMLLERGQARQLASDTPPAVLRSLEETSRLVRERSKDKPNER